MLPPDMCPIREMGLPWERSLWIDQKGILGESLSNGNYPKDLLPVHEGSVEKEILDGGKWCEDDVLGEYSGSTIQNREDIGPQFVT